MKKSILAVLLFLSASNLPIYATSTTSCSFFDFFEVISPTDYVMTSLTTDGNIIAQNQQSINKFTLVS